MTTERLTPDDPLDRARMLLALVSTQPSVRTEHAIEACAQALIAAHGDAEVWRKHYSEPYVIPCFTSTKGICFPQVHPASYRLRIDNGHDAGWVNVTPAEYDRTRVGERWPEGAKK